MEFLYLKSLHIIFVITWFAGLFYIVRLFIYHTEAESKPSPEKEILQKQYKLMSKRLWYIITWPSAILATGFAIWMLVQNPAYLTMSWMLIKIGFVGLLILYHLVCQRIYSQLQNDIIKSSSFKLRMFNEVATILLFAIVFLVVLKSTINWVWGVVGIIAIGLLLMGGIQLYKKVRIKNEEE
ncbi:MAG: protoporphyrinogen IX oxidase [Bacteroidetes bacterium MedPE-SWsnd-G1]|nr:MAG: protoporphyrinogen IX oxidase [Bacteroidetes bacterium MedPE-SWsnd-G1]